MGKSSLVNQVLACNAHRTDRLVIRLCMGEYTSAPMFWKEFLDQLRDAIEDADLWNDRLGRCYAELDSFSIQDSNWSLVFLANIKRIFKQLVKAQAQVLLVIDEFDAVVNVFGDTVSEYMLLRSLYSEPGTYCLNGVIISRRTLKFMEQNVDSLSTLHGVFTRETLDEFNQADMAEFYRVLAESGIHMSEDAKDQLLEYTGGIPYLCSMFGQRLVAGYANAGTVDSSVINAIYKERKASIVEYYDDLIDRLKADEHLEPLVYLSLGSLQHFVDYTHVETMQSIGVLRYDDCIGHYAYSADFMKYLKTKPLDIPRYQLLVGAEKKLKQLLGKVFPKLEETSYQDIRGGGGFMFRSELENAYAWLGIKWVELEKSLSSLSNHMRNPSVLDGLSLTHVINGILANWEQSFCHYFQGSNEWVMKLQLIRELSAPLASANAQYITNEKLAACSQYCTELIGMDL